MASNAKAFQRLFEGCGGCEAGSGRGSVRAELLKGPTEDPSMDWITMGYPQLAQAWQGHLGAFASEGSGKFYFEVNLIEGFGSKLAER